MLIFLLAADPLAVKANQLKERLVQLPSAHSADVQIIHQMNVDTMFTHALIRSDEPICLTLHEGEQITERFLTELIAIADELPPHVAGIVPAHASKLRGPLLWRTTNLAELSPLTRASAGKTPFWPYVLALLQAGVSVPYSQWETRRLHSWQPASPLPRWRRPSEEQAAIEAVMSAQLPLAAVQAEAEPPTFSIVICTHNDALFLPWAIHSVLVQSHTSWELIIVDDGSTDHTQDVIQSLAGHPQIRSLQLPVSIGKSAALNQALADLQGNWLIELDADDWLEPDCLTFFAASIASCDSGEPPSAFYAGHYEWTQRACGELVFGGTSHVAGTFDPKKLLTEGRPLAPRCMHIPTLKQLGGWRTDDPLQGRLYEDFQILIRLDALGAVTPIRELLYHRRLRHDSMTARHRAHYDLLRQWFMDHLVQAPDLDKLE